MIVYDFDLVGVAIFPDKANAPLVVDAYAVLPGPVTLQPLEPIARGNTQGVKARRRVQLRELTPSHWVLASADRSARALIKLAPLRESGYQLLMQVLEGQGNISEALSLYENLRLRVREELGANPGSATQALQLRLLRGDHR